MRDFLNINLEELILTACENFNKYRNPEATAELVKIDKRSFIIDFNGSFCLSCGVRDYFEDLIFEIKDVNNKLRVEIKSSNQVGHQRYRVHYIFVKESENIKPKEESLFKKFLIENEISFEKYIESNVCTKDVIKFHFRTWKSEKNDQ